MLRNNIQRDQCITERPERDRMLSGYRAAKQALLILPTLGISTDNREYVSRLLSGKINWGHLVDLAEFHGVVSLVFHNLTKYNLGNLVPEPYLERLDRSYKGTLFKNVAISAEMDSVLGNFDKNGISVIALKGAILAEQLYGNPGLRPMSDIDIMVKSEDLPRAGSLLLEMGYQQMEADLDRPHAFHESPYYRQGPISLYIELHWNLDNPKLVAIPLQEIWQRAQSIQIRGKTIKVLSPEDNMLFLMVHMHKHSDNTLKSLIDVMLMIKKYQGILDWDYILKSARSWEVEIGIYYALRWSKELLGAPVPSSLLRELKPGVLRKWILGSLISRNSLISPIKNEKLRIEKWNLVNSLMRRHFRQSLTVLSHFRKQNRRLEWLRTLIWVVLVFCFATGSNIFNAFRYRL